MARFLPILAAVVLVLVTGLVHGLWTERWHRSRDLEDAVARLQRVPGDLGDWKIADTDVDAESLELAGARGHWIRRYTHKRTGQVALVILLCGRSGQISVHRPEHCYGGAGYNLSEPAVHWELKPTPDGAAAEFWTGRFRKDEATRSVHLRIFWSWFANETWKAPEEPRVAFAPAYRPLYKLYVVHETEAAPDAPDKDPTVDLIRRLIPALNRALTTAPE